MSDRNSAHVFSDRRKSALVSAYAHGTLRISLRTGLPRWRGLTWIECELYAPTGATEPAPPAADVAPHALLLAPPLLDTALRCAGGAAAAMDEHAARAWGASGGGIAIGRACAGCGAGCALTGVAALGGGARMRWAKRSVVSRLRFARASTSAAVGSASGAFRPPSMTVRRARAVEAEPTLGRGRRRRRGRFTAKYRFAPNAAAAARTPGGAPRRPHGARRRNLGKISARAARPSTPAPIQGPNGANEKGKGASRYGARTRD